MIRLPSYTDGHRSRSRDGKLPQVDERSEQFVVESIQMALRSLAHIRAARISPAVLTAPPAEFVPPPRGVGLPSPPVPGGQQLSSDASGDVKGQTRGLLEERVERDVWHDVLDALTRLRGARRAATERGISAAVTSGGGWDENDVFMGAPGTNHDVPGCFVDPFPDLATLVGLFTLPPLAGRHTPRTKCNSPATP
ncbi:hypothetical protein EDB92DRAFT_123812 [Lactarius akahatsu]|uniref:Uncharacterized protein n=1 Tax=Lactarius akahatsu TaxID=416441 RepID=A0AAD4LAI2_9AGAM|nr:hypothetical protein EDB92DRAFT_123812 [Lactarius akahatsu]